jgi:RNA polymerase sigma-70 factor (ECF subfamily)
MELAPALTTTHDLEQELVALYPALARRMAMVLRDPDIAQDIAQSTMVRALEHRRRFNGGDLRAWVYTIGLRLAFNELRRRRTVQGRSSAEEPTWAMTMDPDLWVALAAIEPRARAALFLSVLDGYTHAEIGRILGAPEGTVSSWLSRAKDRLRSALEEDDR